MKRLILATLIIATTTTAAFAQKDKSEGAFGSGTAYVHVGVGFGGGFSTGSVTLPPISASFEKAVSEKISVGAIVGYSSSKYNFGLSTDDIKYTYLLLGARGNYHFATSAKFDPYVGLTLGYNIVKVTVPASISGYAAKASALLYGGQIGANYYFASNFGAFAELGYGIGIGTIGVSLKF